MRSDLIKVIPPGIRSVARRLLEKAAHVYLQRLPQISRYELALTYIQGEGIEFGPLNAPLPVGKRANVRYADRYSNEFMLERHDGIPKDLKPLTYITSLETCEGIPDASQDFIIANHVIEHLENPILAIENMLRILKEGGIVFLAIPDRRYTFDFDRELTTFEHLLRDYQDGPEWSRFDHYLDVSEKLFDLKGEEAQSFAKQLFDEGLDTHFHVWEQHSAMEMMLRLKSDLGFHFDIVANTTYPNESVFVLRKVNPNRALPRPETTSLFSKEKARRAGWVEEQTVYNPDSDS